MDLERSVHGLWGLCKLGCTGDRGLLLCSEEDRLTKGAGRLSKQTLRHLHHRLGATTLLSFISPYLRTF